MAVVELVKQKERDDTEKERGRMRERERERERKSCIEGVSASKLLNT